MTNSEDPDQTAPQGVFTVLSVLSVLILSFYGIEHFISRGRTILTWFLKVKKILAVFLEFWSNWLRLITLCENFTVFWGSCPDCFEETVCTASFQLAK